MPLKLGMFLTPEKWFRSMALLGTEVMPRLADLRTGPSGSYLEHADSEWQR